MSTDPNGIQRRIISRLSLPLLLALAVTGCGRGAAFDGQPPVAPVEGVVSYQGKPVPNANLTFYPQAEGEAGVAITDEQGRFRVSTYQRLDGAVLGSHVVTVTVPTDGPALPGGPEEKNKQQTVPKIYQSRETSPVTVTVMPDVKNHYELTLEK